MATGPTCHRAATTRDGFDRRWRQRFACHLCHRDFTHASSGASYPNLSSIPGVVEAVVIGTRPELADSTMRECADLGIKHVWMHRSVGARSVSASAAQYGREDGITVIDGGCPLMSYRRRTGCTKPCASS